MPDKYEAGTPNIVGLAGLAASVRYLIEYGLNEIIALEHTLTRRLIDGLDRIRKVHVVGTKDAQRQTAVVSFTIDGAACSEIARKLDEEFDIMCRPGLHCAPRAHRTLQTYPEGTVRFAAGPFTSEGEIDRAIDAVKALAAREADG